MGKKPLGRPNVRWEDTGKRDVENLYRTVGGGSDPGTGVEPRFLENWMRDEILRVLVGK